MIPCRRYSPGAGPARFSEPLTRGPRRSIMRTTIGGPRIQYLPEKERNRGPASYDRTHNLQMYGVYDLPFGKGQRWLMKVGPARFSAVSR